MLIDQKFTFIIECAILELQKSIGILMHRSLSRQELLRLFSWPNCRLKLYHLLNVLLLSQCANKLEMKVSSMFNTPNKPPKNIPTGKLR